jgi:uncharacterized coiled-coil DUF342 family protein
MRTSSEWIEYRKHDWLGRDDITELIDDLARMEAEWDTWRDVFRKVERERDALQADSTKAITVVTGLIAERDEWRDSAGEQSEKLLTACTERDEWKAMADRASQALVEHLGEFEKAQDDLAALRAKGEKLAEAVGRVQGILDAVDPSSRAAVEIQTICDAALEEWRKE